MLSVYIVALLVGVSGESLQPSILTSPSVLNISLGATATLQCQVSHLGSMVLLWKRGTRVIFAGNMKVRRDDRLSLSGTDLVISKVSLKDGGEYTCEIETDRKVPLAIVHRLEVLQPPTVKSHPGDGIVTVKRGTTVTLECAAQGNPHPTVTWTKRNQDLGGLPHSVGEGGRRLVLPNVTVSHSGSYTCTADNGVGQPAREKIAMKVLYSPSASADTSVVQGGIGCQVSLVCMVRGEPVPKVSWYKDTMVLGSSSNLLVQATGMRHSLTIPSLRDTDFANYSCLAHNQLGKDRAYVSISGLPGTPVFDQRKSGRGFYLQWTTQSFSKITEYSLFYRQVQDPLSVHSDVEYGWKSLVLGGDSEYSENSSCSQGQAQNHSVLIDNLEPATGYEAKVRAMNRFGWSNTSDTFQFRTPQMESPPQESQIRQIGTSSSSSSSPASVKFKKSFLCTVTIVSWILLSCV